MILSGGEPLLRKDSQTLISCTKQGIRLHFTNGTLLRLVGCFLKKVGIGYIGVSLDGIGENNDRFRGREGAFKALAGIRNCREIDQRVGLRFYYKQT